MTNENSFKIQAWQLKQRQSLPLPEKILFSLKRIEEWWTYWEGMVYVSFSGGLDSSVLLHLVRQRFPEVPAVFVDTGLEFPEIKENVGRWSGVEVVRPKLSFPEVIRNYGYPVVSKRVSQYVREARKPTERNAVLLKKRIDGIDRNGRKVTFAMIPEKWKRLLNAPFAVSEKCCDVMKKNPLRDYLKRTGRYPFVGTTAGESLNRELDYLRLGCNVFESKKQPMSRPLAIWTHQDILEYTVQFGLPVASCYGDIYRHEDKEWRNTGEPRTGCMFCAFGAHLESPNRFERIKETHPKIWRYCMEQLGMREVLEFCGIPTGEEANND